MHFVFSLGFIVFLKMLKENVLKFLTVTTVREKVVAIKYPILLKFFIYLFLVALGLLAVCWHSLVEASGGCFPWYVGFPLWWLLLLQRTGSRHSGFSNCGYRLSCSVACGICSHQGLNPRPLCWQADSYPLLHHQESPNISFLRFHMGHAPFLQTPGGACDFPRSPHQACPLSIPSLPTLCQGTGWEGGICDNFLWP